MTSSGSAVAVNAVKPRRSQNTTVTPVALQQLVVSTGCDQVEDLRWQKTPQATDPFDFRNLLGDTLLERAVPRRQLILLLFEHRGLLLHFIV